MRIQNQYLKSYKCQSEKFIPNAPLSKKQVRVIVEEPVQEILDTFSPQDKISFVRRAIGEALVREGLLAQPEVGSNGNSN